jgi:hypothetical protein
MRAYNSCTGDKELHNPSDGPGRSYGAIEAIEEMFTAPDPLGRDRTAVNG